jgi:flagellar biosynthetic protein FlhB
VSAAAGEKSEKATPKKRDEARKKGTVAKSADINGVAVLLAGFGILAALAPAMLDRMENSMRHLLQLMGTPSVVSIDGLGALFGELGIVMALTVGPIAAGCMAAGFIANIAQVKWKPSWKSVKPDPRKLNPVTGAKNLLGKRALFELAKNLLKVTVVGVVVFMVVTPKMDELAALVGMPPAALLVELSKQTLSIAMRACVAYLFIALADYAYQRYSTEKSMKMTKDEVKQEFKGQEASSEVRGARKRRQMEGARARMMQDVPEADVVVTNPTHYAVALKYDAEKAAPVVVAKGKDLIAARIRQLAGESGVPIVPDPPLARSLHASVEVGQMIPEELYQTVAQLLAFVYRTAGRRRQLTSTTTVTAAAA